jgi:subtilisin family serine protease
LPKNNFLMKGVKNHMFSRKKKKVASLLLASFLTFSTLVPSTGLAAIQSEGKGSKTAFVTKKEKKAQTPVKSNNKDYAEILKKKKLQFESSNNTTPNKEDKGKKPDKARKSQLKPDKNGKENKSSSQKATKPNSDKVNNKVVASFKKDKHKKEKYVQDELIIKFKPKTNAETVRQKFKLKTKTKLKSIGAEVVKIAKDQKVESLINSLAKDPSVQYVQPNFKYYPDTTPNDTYFGELWGLDNQGQEILGQQGTPNVDIDAPEAWEQARNLDEVVVAVIDTGIDINHPDLKDVIWTNPDETPGNNIDDDGNGYVDDVHGWDFYHDDGTVYDIYDGDEHGTHVAGTIAATTNNNLGVSGIAPNVKIMPIKFLGPYGGSTEDAILAIEYAASMGVKLSNNSWGGGDYDQALKDAIEQSGMLFVAAAGNDSVNTDEEPHYPSSYNNENILSVAAIDNQGNLAGFSNYGFNSVDIGAPGVNILSTVPKKFEAGAAAQIDLGNSKAIFNGFGFETIPDEQSRLQAFDKALKYLGATATSNILLVQDDESDAQFPNFLSVYKNMLQTLGYNHVVQTVPAGTDGPSLSTLENYDIVIWFTGFGWGSGADSTLTSTDQSNLTSYLNNGGNLLLSGQDALFRIEQTPFVTNVLHLDIIGEGPSRDVMGVENTIYSEQQYALSFAPYVDWIFSNDESTTTVNLLYPEEKDYTNAYAYYNGTSMATPHVTGVAALLFGQQPQLDAIEAANIIKNSGEFLSSLSGITSTGMMAKTVKDLNVNPDDDIPGVQLYDAIVEDTLDETSDTDDVYSVFLHEGETISISLDGQEGTDFDLYVFAPYAHTVNNSNGMLSYSESEGTSKEFIEFQAPEEGMYYIDVYAYSGSGSYTLTAGNGAGEYEDDSSSLIYEGSWSTVTNTAYSGGTAKTLNSTGHVTFTFIGNEFEWIGFKNSNQGIARIYIDGAAQEVSLYSSTFAANQSLFKKELPYYGRHEVRIEWTGKRDPKARKSGAAINVDKLIVRENLTPPSAPENVKVFYAFNATGQGAPVVTWDEVVNAKGYNVLRKEANETEFKQLNASLIPYPYFFDDSAVVGKTYEYKVIAVGYKNMQSEPSAAVTYIYDDDIPGIPASGSTLSGEVAAWDEEPGDDFDVWSVNLQQGQTYSFALKGPDGTDFDILVYGPETQTIYDFNYIRSGTSGYSEEYVTLPVEQTGTYYIAVRAFTGKGSYTVNIGQKPTVNDDDIPGVPLTTNKVSDFLDSYDYDDVYSVDLKAGDTITVNLSTTAKNFNDFDVYLYPPNATTVDPYASNYVTEVAMSNAAGTSTETFTYTATQDGKYFIDVNWNGGSAPYDLAVNIQPAAPTPTLETKVIENNDPAVKYSGTWNHITQSGNSGNSLSYSNQKDAYAELSFDGTAIQVLSKTSPPRGLADIYIDNQFVATVDLYRTKDTYQDVIFTKDGLTNTTHTIKIVVKGQKSSAATGTTVAIDAFVVSKPKVVITTIENNDPAVKYSGAWSHISQSGNSGNSLSYSTQKDAYAELSFDGTAIQVLSKTSPPRGLADIYIDNQFVATVDLYRTKDTYQDVIFTKDGLTNTTHTIKIVVKGQKSSAATGTTVAIDAFVITK